MVACTLMAGTEIVVARRPGGLGVGLVQASRWPPAATRSTAARRTATIRAITPCRVAVVLERLLDRDALAELAKGRRGADLDSSTDPISE